MTRRRRQSENKPWYAALRGDQVAEIRTAYWTARRDHEAFDAAGCGDSLNLARLVRGLLRPEADGPISIEAL